jgi:hypothetical protein
MMEAMRTLSTAALAAFVTLCGCHHASLPDTPPAGPWTASVVAPNLAMLNPFGTSTSLAADAAGNAAIAFGDDELHLAHYEGALGWSIRTFSVFGASKEDGLGSVVRFDGAARPVIAVAHRTGPSSAQVLFGDGGQAIMPATGGVLTDLDMALDASGRPHLVFDESDSGLGYAAWDGTSWQTEAVDGAVGIEVAIALDAAGRPWIAHSTLDFRLIVGTRADDGTWQLWALDRTDGSQLHSPSLAIDSQGRAQVAWIDGTSGTLKYALRDDSGWHVENVAAHAGHVALALDAADVPHFSFAAPSGEAGTARLVAPLQYAVRDPGGWTLERVGDADESAAWSSLVIGGDGIARVSWWDFASGSVRYAARAN